MNEPTVDEYDLEKTAEICYNYTINDIQRQQQKSMSFYFENIFEDDVTICGIRLCKRHQTLKEKIKKFLCDYIIKNEVTYYIVNQERMEKIEYILKEFFSTRQPNVTIRLDHIVSTQENSYFYFNFDSNLDFPFPPVYVVVDTT